MTSDKPVLTLLKGYVERDPSTAAHVLETMDEEEAVSVLTSLPHELCAEVFQYLQPVQTSALLKEISPELFSVIARRIEPEHAASVLLRLGNETRRHLLSHLPEGVKKKVQDLLVFPVNSAGRIMSTSFLAFHEEAKVKDAVQKIRSLANRQALVTYAYVIDMNNRLIGILNMRDLLIAEDEAALGSIMKKEVFVVDGFMDREEVANELSQRHLLAAPVIDAQQRLLGVVKANELIDDIQEEGTEDILKMAGAGGDERTFSPVHFSMQKRLPWLYVNLATAFLAAGVIALFESVIAKVTILAVFLPVVAGQGGNAGAQSMAVVMRGLVLREIHHSNALKLLFKETFLGLLNGLVIGIVTAIAAWGWGQNPYLGLVIGLAMVVNLTAAGLAGAGIPLLLKALGFDPAQSSNIVLTTVTDVLGFFAFLGFALLFQGYLV